MTKPNKPSSVVLEEVAYGSAEYANDPSFEIAWAVKAAERANIHMSLLLTCNTNELTMHKKYSVIYDKFRELFPKMNIEEVAEVELKGKNKQHWYTFCEHFKEEVEDYNLATIMRIRADGAYSEANTIVVPKIIFLAVEIARNKEGVNEKYKESFKVQHEKIRREGGNICFTFGAQGTTTAAPAASTLFGGSSKPLFAAPTTTAQATGLFGSTVPAGGLFATAAKTANGLVGTTGVVMTSATGGSFGSTSATTPGLFGTTSSATTTGSLFGKPATGLFSSSTTATPSLAGGLFGASGAPTVTTGIGLGGTGTLTATGLTSSGCLGVAGAAASGNPLEAEVPQVLMDLFNLLRDQIKKNHELYVEFAMNSSESCLHMDEKIEQLVGVRVRNTDAIRKAKAKADELLDKMQRDLRVAEQVRRRQKEISKNPHFGRKQAFSYLLEICAEHENTVREFWETLQLLEERIGAKLNKKDITTKQDLQKHFEHYDQAFKVICSDVYRCKVQIEDLKDAFLEYQKNTTPYVPNPFGRQKSKHVEKSSAETKFRGVDAFPSQITMMKIGEMAKPSSAAQQTTGTSGFGTTGSLFGSKTFGSPAFSFNSSISNATAPLFKPFCTTSSAPAPLFGNSTTSAASVPTTASSFTFGNTLNSSVSGTLFGGSASKPFGR
uniref:Polysaccharide biosynthesis domain-containing protein n=1 Tax=Setaria digitata TaxID=48799 RepID=A0A915PJU0_9BILA